jgi:hypothetical protein
MQSRHRQSFGAKLIKPAATRIRINGPKRADSDFSTSASAPDISNSQGVETPPSRRQKPRRGRSIETSETLASKSPSHPGIAEMTRRGVLSSRQSSKYRETLSHDLLFFLLFIDAYGMDRALKVAMSEVLPLRFPKPIPETLAKFIRLRKKKQRTHSISEHVSTQRSNLKEEV